MEKQERKLISWKTWLTYGLCAFMILAGVEFLHKAILPPDAGRIIKAVVFIVMLLTFFFCLRYMGNKAMKYDIMTKKQE